MSTILVVDDKEMMRDSVAETLRRAGFTVMAAGDGKTALEAVARKRPDAVVTDLKMPGMTGVELLDKIVEIDAELPVILMTAYGTIQTAVDAMKRGAFDYVTKPFEGDELMIAVKRGVKQAKLSRENAVLRAAAQPAGTSEDGGAQPAGLGRIIGDSPAMRRVKEQIAAIAGSHGTVLITGESGTGKEVIARAIHELSPRAQAAFLAVNCAALSESLLESELFGHERGAFTGAEKLRKGRFELAHSGSLLLDEVSEVSPQIQAKLLRALQERAFERVGSSVTLGVDVRVIATSNRDLPAEAERGSFRSDLFFRLNVLPIHLPPLRERAGDVPQLARHFLAEIGRRDGSRPAELTPDAEALMAAYHWPGNVRELQNICERAAVLTAADGDAIISRQRIEPWIAGGPAPREPEIVTTAAVQEHNGLNGWDRSAVYSRSTAVAEPKPIDVFEEGDVRQLADIERDVIIETLRHFGGHRQKTARALGIGVRTLGLKLKKWKEEQLIPASL